MVKEKLVYRSHFEPAPRGLTSSKNDRSGLPVRRGSPFPGRSRRSVTRTTLRATLLLVAIYLLFLWIRSLTGLDFGVDGWVWAPFSFDTSVKSMQQWRENYDAMELGLEGLPESFTLPSGDHIPTVALGTWLAKPGEVGKAVMAALDAGYRHIDGAWIYGNEAEVGKALAEAAAHVPRESIFITSKLWNTFHAPEDIEPALDETLAKLQTDYLDLYLIHWPVAVDRDGHVDEALTEHPIKTWKKLEELVDKGKIRNIGVSNFNIRRIQNLTSSDIRIKPAVNQVELNYWLPQADLVKWSKENGILLEAYSPLGGARTVSKTLSLPIVKEISRTLKITPAQVLISWHVQRGTVVLPKSVSPGRISENYQLFRLPGELFDKLENAANSHPPHRGSDMSSKVGYDIFEDDKEELYMEHL